MNIDLKTVPFSRYGSYLAFSYLPQNADLPAGLYLRTVHGDAVRREVCLIEPLQGQTPAPFTIQAEPDCLRLLAEAGVVEVCFAEPKVIRIRSRGVGLRLTFQHGTYIYAMPVPGKRWQINSFIHRLSFVGTPLVGHLAVDAPWQVDRASRVMATFTPQAASGIMECAIEEIQSVWEEREYTQSFDDCLEQVKGEFETWLGQTPAAPVRYAEAWELAAYINWSCVVAPLGHLQRPAMLMSKNWMANVWSWDHCFNAMALAYKHPALAWDQLMLMFDCQDPQGGLPDSINDKLMIWNFCKPPIHGWTLKRMLERTDFITPQHLKEVYTPLCRWTEWWLKYRDHDQDGIPQYHHGNDSGWDNCTAFETGLPLESPDLAAFLIIQMEALAEVAGRLGDQPAAMDWQKRAQGLLADLLAHSWRGDHFVATRSGDHFVRETDTLFLFLPILLGKRLPVAVRAALTAGLRQGGRFLTEYGLATESPSSPYYQPDGYWRGPIWAPSTMIIVDGLAALGEVDLAREISRRFCEMAARSGMAENFNALTGAGLRDRAYTWTASVFLILAHEYLENGTS